VQKTSEWSASGQALKGITGTLNAEHLRSPRPREDRVGGEWCPAAICEILKTGLYIGCSESSEVE
jgi:hypothetical protein